MVASNSSTSVTLLFAEQPAVNFARYVENLDLAFTECAKESYKLRWDNDEYVTFDVDGSRVALCFAEIGSQPLVVNGAFSRPYSAAMILSVGPGETPVQSTDIAARARDICTTVVDRITASHQPDMVMWRSFEGPFTADTFEDMMTDASMMQVPFAAAPELARDLWSDSDMKAPIAERTAAIALRVSNRIPRPEMSQDRPEGRVIPMRREVPIAAGPARRPARMDMPAYVRPANRLPDLPAPKSDENARVRAALYSDEAADRPSKGPLTRRLALYAANTTLLLVALPVGAALLTYNVLGREDAGVTARAMALTGAVIGLASTSLGHAFLPLI